VSSVSTPSRPDLKVASKFGVDHVIDISCGGAQSVVTQIRTALPA
jgi:hypothetical protein